MIPRLRPYISRDEFNSIIFGKTSVADFEIEFANFTKQSMQLHSHMVEPRYIFY